MPRRSHPTCTFGRKPLSPEFSSAQFSMVRIIHVYLSVLTLFVWFALGIAIILFFQCMAALFNPIHRRGEGIKWGLVSYTLLMFSFVTVFTAINLNIKSNSFIDNRQFTDPDGTLLGPLGYQTWFRSNMLSITFSVMFPLANWLADGLLVRPLLVLSSLAWVSDIRSSSSSTAAT